MSGWINIFHCADIHPGLGKQGSTQKVNKQCCVVYRSETHWLSYQNPSLMSKYTLKIHFSERFFKCIYNSHNLFEKILFNESTQCHTFLGILCPPSSRIKILVSYDPRGKPRPPQCLINYLVYISEIKPTVTANPICKINTTFYSKPYIWNIHQLLQQTLSSIFQVYLISTPHPNDLCVAMWWWTSNDSVIVKLNNSIKIWFGKWCIAIFYNRG